MFTIFVIYKCIKEKVKPNIVAILFLMIIDFALVFSLIGISKVQAATAPSEYLFYNRKTTNNGWFNAYYCKDAKQMKQSSQNFLVTDDARQYIGMPDTIVYDFFENNPQYLDYSTWFYYSKSTGWWSWHVLTFPAQDVDFSINFGNISLVTDNGEGINNIYSWSGNASISVTLKDGVSSSEGKYFIIDDNSNVSVNETKTLTTSSPTYSEGTTDNERNHVMLGHNVKMNISNSISSWEGAYYYDDTDLTRLKPYITNTTSSLQYMNNKYLEISENNISGLSNFAFQLYECDATGNMIQNAPFFFELSGLDSNSPYFISSGGVNYYRIPFYDFVNVELKSGHLYNWCLLGAISGTDFIVDNVINSYTTWTNAVGINDAILDNQNNISTSIENNANWQQEAASGDYDFSSISSPSFEDPTAGITNLFSGIVDTLSNWESESLILKIPTSQNGFQTGPYILEIPGNYVEERLKWMFTTYDDMSVNPSHSGFVIINIIKTVWCFVFGRWIFLIVRKLVDKIKSGKILDNNIEDITGNML